MSRKLSTLWFFIHFSLEVICFQYYTLFFGNLPTAYIMAFMYDVIAFFPQFFIGKLSERFNRLPLGLIGAVLVLTGSMAGLFADRTLLTIGFILISAGNAFVHVGGAEATIYTCCDKIAPAAIFVSGGAIGVITGKLIGRAAFPVTVGFFVMTAGTVLIVLSEHIFRGAERITPKIRMADTRRSTTSIILLAFFVVTVRGLLGYGIPASWNTTPFRNFIFFFMMAAGKALGGILSDTIGARRTALISVGASLPLLLLGDRNMLLSLIGIALFSMTMASTLGILISAVPEHPLMAYGVTTTGLLLGTIPVFMPGVMGFISNVYFLAIMTVLCFAALAYIMRPDKAPEKINKKGDLS